MKTKNNLELDDCLEAKNSLGQSKKLSMMQFALETQVTHIQTTNTFQSLNEHIIIYNSKILLYTEISCRQGL